MQYCNPMLFYISRPNCVRMQMYVHYEYPFFLGAQKGQDILSHFVHLKLNRVNLDFVLSHGDTHRICIAMGMGQ